MNYLETIEIAKKELQREGVRRLAYVGAVVGVIVLFDKENSSCKAIGEKAAEIIKDFHVNSCTFNKYINGKWGHQINIERDLWGGSVSDEEFYNKLNKYKELI